MTFQNLRSTRETELAEQFPMHVVCKWIGNSQPVAAKHYLQLTDEHFERAIAGELCATPHAAQKAAQNAHETTRNESKAMIVEDATTSANAKVFEPLPIIAGMRETWQVPWQGLEPWTR